MMSMNVQIGQHLYAGTSAMIEIPDIDSWDDIEAWHIHWDTLHYVLKADPDKWLELELDSETLDNIEWARPMTSWVYELDEDGDQIGEVVAKQ